jgi:hypothetical protein
LAFSFTAMAVAVENDGSAVSVLATSSSKVVLQDEVVPPAPVPTSPEAAAPAPVADQTVMEGPIVMDGSAGMMAPGACGGCNTCCVTPCRCCPPPPVSMTFCLQDPCCCSHQVDVCVPACCAGEEPCITWRKGILGRQIATMCWKCCGHEVKVTICRSGKVKVRG